LVQGPRNKKKIYAKHLELVPRQWLSSAKMKINTDILVKVCKALDCDIGDTMEIVHKKTT